MIQFVDILLADTQGIDNDVFAVELHIVESAEGGGVLVLLATSEAKVYSLDFICQACNVVLAEGEFEPFDVCAQYGDNKR